MNNNKTRLYPEDQQKVDEFLHSGINKVDRKAFQPFRLMIWLTVCIIILGVLSQIIGQFVIPS